MLLFLLWAARRLGPRCRRTVDALGVRCSLPSCSASVSVVLRNEMGELGDELEDELEDGVVVEKAGVFDFGKVSVF